MPTMTINDSEFSTRRGSPSVKIPRVLLIDDDDIFRELMVAAGREYPYIIDAYPSLAALGSFARLGGYELAILDFHLPDMNGSEIAEYIEIFFKDTPVVMISADAQPPAHDLKKHLCIRSFVHKGIGIERMWRIVHEILAAANHKNDLPPNP